MKAAQVDIGEYGTGTERDPNAEAFDCRYCGATVPAQYRERHYREDCTEVDRTTIHSRE